jgi:hypothetical protein
MFTIGKRFGENNFAIPLDNSNPFGAVSSPYNKSLNLIGEPARYPFDKYYLNLVFAIPFAIPRTDTSVNNIVDFNDLVRASWSPPDYNASYPLSSINRDKLIPVFNRIFGLDQKGSPTICDVIKRTPQMVNLSQIPFSSVLCEYDTDYTTANVKIDFTRNYAIAVIVIPLIAIFYLLGAIFIFESSPDNISNRLTLTLGIFALIFTLPEVINSMKPATSGPTIADSMLSIIIIATIAFTISSVISSSSIIRNWFPNRYTWIDGIVFLIVSGLVVAYFSNFPFDITIWLIPIIVFGLGYGLLLRILGVKITKPIFAKRKKTTIPKV